MTDKNILYYYEECMLSIEEIARLTKLSVEDIQAVISRTPTYKPLYVPRMRYSRWVNGK